MKDQSIKILQKCKIDTMLIDNENLEISDIEMMKLMIDALSREIIEHTIGLFIISLQRYHIQVMIG